jgi:hypothetical protein
MMEVKSVSLYWQENRMEIIDTAGGKHTLPLDCYIKVTMVGYPDRETKTMQAHDLDAYIMRGYRIEQIEEVV